MNNAAGRRGAWWSHLYTQVVVGIALGVAVGWAFPDFGAAKPLSDGFIRLVKMLIAPVVFCTVVAGIARVGDLREVGRVGLKALVYFEAVSTLALAIGLVVVNVVKPGVGVNADLSRLDAGAVSGYTKAAATRTTSEMLLHAIPDSAVGAFASGEILQVLVFSVLFGIGLSKSGAAGKPVLDLIERLGHVMFDVFGVVMRAAPVGAFGAMAYTVGKLGLESLLPLVKLMACVYLTCILFVFVALGSICRLAGFRLWRFLVYIKEEILLVLGTSSSEAALPPLMTKLEAAGCAPSVVGLVVPTGYSFNLDGTSIYLTMAAVFVAQAFNVPLTLGDQLALMAVLLLTSKGAAAVTGGGFITLAATLSTTGKVPVAGLALLLGIDRFMSEARAITNLIGNGVAAMAVARWEGALDLEQAHAALNGVPRVDPSDPPTDA